MNVRELRRKYLEFFESKGHTVYPSGSLIPYDVTGRLDQSLLFNGAGMIQFKPYFRGTATPTNKRLTTVQKCVRTGDIESVGNLSHLTFFEMLGNFSFGDYFKKEAIEFSWEFLTSPQWLNLDPRRLSFTVFHEDDEAYGYWHDLIVPTGIAPDTRIFRLGEETNYWPAGSFSSGPPGPCGPNSEMFYWTHGEPPSTTSGEYSVKQWLLDDEAKNWLEIWNDVFIQYEWQGSLRNPDRPSDGYAKTGMPDLPFRSIDTGMGLDRTATVLGGFRSVYDTDAFKPITNKIGELCGVSYLSDGDKDRAFRIIADHIRTSTFCIGDGILPGNNGRGYVLRRLIRRAILKGRRTLGINKPFLAELAPVVIAEMGDVYSELVERQAVILETLRNEENLFLRTLESGTSLLTEEIARLPKGSKEFPGDIAFKLYDTYGFPLEITTELCEEEGLTVNVEQYEAALAEAQERSRAVSGMETVYGGTQQNVDWGSTPTEFTGYTETTGVGTVLVAVNLGEDKIGVALNRTPFYAQSGGQIADTGEISIEGRHFEVVNVTKSQGVFVHLVEAPGIDATTWVGKSADCQVDAERRARIKRNHTATHLLHAALRAKLGTHVTQAGSYVGPDRLRFDFTHGKAMTQQEIAEVEKQVNSQALLNLDVTTYADLPIEEAKAKGAMALFGEKYGDKVRMVEIGDTSRELCGGIHVRSSAEVGLFRIISESSAASGVRRIEAVTGEAAYELLLEQADKIRQAAELLKTSPREIVMGAEKAVEQARELSRKIEKLRAQGASKSQTQSYPLSGYELTVMHLEEGEAKDATSAADRLVDGAPKRLALVAVVTEGKVLFVAKAGSEAVQQGAHAGNLVKELAKLTGGGGGGRPDFATAGGRLVEKLSEALAAAPTLLN